MNNITIDTFKNIIEENIPEDLTSEYKGYIFEDGKISENYKQAIEEEVCAFANAQGGTIFIGIAEKQDKSGYFLQDVGCEVHYFDQIQLTLQTRLQSKVKPKIYGIKINKYELENDRFVMTIEIPKCINKPYAVCTANKDIFKIRTGNGTVHMGIDDLRREFTVTSKLREDIYRFRQERINYILGNEYFGDLKKGAKLLIQIIPLWSTMYGNIIDLSKVEIPPIRNILQPMCVSIWDESFVLEGKCLYKIDSEDNKLLSSVILFRNGIIETLEMRMMNYQEDYTKEIVIYNWHVMEQEIIKYVNNYSIVLNDLNIPKPWYIFISIINGKGQRAKKNCGYTRFLQRDIINATECVWNDEQDLKEVIKPTLDSLANAFGLSKSDISINL